MDCIIFEKLEFSCKSWHLPFDKLATMFFSESIGYRMLTSYVSEFNGTSDVRAAAKDAM